MQTQNKPRYKKKTREDVPSDLKPSVFLKHVICTYSYTYRMQCISVRKYKYYVLAVVSGEEH